MKLRKASKADQAAISNCDSIAAKDPARVLQIKDWLEHDLVLLAELKTKVIGYGVLNHSFFRQATIEMLMIHTEYRGQAVGQELMTALEKLCSKEKLWVTTNLSNKPMQKLLSRLGYEPGGYIHALDEGDPELIFYKKMP